MSGWVDAEGGGEAGASVRRHLDGAVRGRSAHPVEVEQAVEQAAPQRAAEVVLLLSPVTKTRMLVLFHVSDVSREVTEWMRSAEKLDVEGDVEPCAAAG